MKKRQPKKQYKLVDGHHVRICDYANCRQEALHTIKIKKGVKIFRCDKHNMVMMSTGNQVITTNYSTKFTCPSGGIPLERKTLWEKIKGLVVEGK